MQLIRFLKILQLLYDGALLACIPSWTSFSSQDSFPENVLSQGHMSPELSRRTTPAQTCRTAFFTTDCLRHPFINHQLTTIFLPRPLPSHRWMMMMIYLASTYSWHQPDALRQPVVSWKFCRCLMMPVASKQATRCRVSLDDPRWKPFSILQT